VHMFQFYFDRKQFKLSGGPAPNDRVVIEEIDAIESIVAEICDLEPQSAPFLPAISSVRGYMANFEAPYAHVVMIETVDNRAAEAGLSSELDDLMPSNSSAARNDSSEWAIFLRREVFAKMAARFFKQSYFSTTETGQLGIGYSSIAAEDEVWLLNGHSAPVILRRLPTGNYRFLGETFIQGMMFGELEESLREANLPVQRIQIE
jgi:hypothetical protein